MKMLLTAAVIAPLSLLLGGCVLTAAGEPDVRVSLPKAPSYYANCFTQLTAKPVGDLTRDKVVKLIAELRQSEKRKSQCGKDLLAWYDTVSQAYAAQGKK